MKKALVCGAGGFIGGHLVARLKREGYWVRGVDIKNHEYGNCPADEFVLGDLRDPRVVASVVDEKMDEVYRLPTWGGPVISSRASTTPVSCTTPRSAI